MTDTRETFAPGMTVRITQQMPRGDHVWTAEVTGTVVKFEQARTGSWYAHSRDDRLWLDRLTLRNDDGEIIILSLDRYSRVDVLDQPAGA